MFGVGGQTINRKIQALAKAAGIEGNITAHSLRITLASTLTERGASLQEVMLAGNWRSASMVAHYSRRAEVQRGAVAKYF